MDKIIKLEREKVDNLYHFLENFVLNLELAEDMDNNSKNNLVEKIRLLNKSMENFENDILDILNDLKAGGCVYSKDLEDRLQEEEQTNSLIKQVSPILLYYLINKQNF